MMAEFQAVNIKKYLRNPRKALDKTDKTPKAEVLSVLSSKFQGEPTEKNFLTERVDADVERVAHLEEPSNLQRVASLHLYGDLLHSLMVWVSRYYDFRIQDPNGLTLNAKPDHVRDAVTQHPWGVLYTDERHVLLTWGDVPASALLGKRDLKTDELLVKEARTAA